MRQKVTGKRENARVGHTARLSALGAALLSVLCLFLILPPLQGPAWVVALAALFCLAAHAMRAVRLAILSVPMLNISGRTAALLHLATAPIVLAVPVKVLAEIVRLHQIAFVGRSLLGAVMILLLERLLDALVLLLIVSWVIWTGPVGRPETLIFWISAGIIVSGAIAFGLAPSMLSGVQRYIIVTHHRRFTRDILRVLDLVRRGTVLGRRELTGNGPALILISAVIWLFELGAMTVIAVYALDLAPASAGGLLLDRTTQEWRILFGQVQDDAFRLVLTVNILPLFLIWPAVVYIYVDRAARQRRTGARPDQDQLTWTR